MSALVRHLLDTDGRGEEAHIITVSPSIEQHERPGVPYWHGYLVWREA